MPQRSGTFILRDLGRILFAAGVFLLLQIVSLAPARGEGDLAPVEVDGLVLDRTLTRVGHDFFREFVTVLGAEDGIPGVSLTVREKVSAQWGGLVTVEANDQTIYSAPLRPKSGGISEIVEQAAAATADYLIRVSSKGLDPLDEDMDRDGL